MPLSITIPTTPASVAQLLAYVAGQTQEPLREYLGSLSFSELAYLRDSGATWQFPPYVYDEISKAQRP